MQREWLKIVNEEANPDGTPGGEQQPTNPALAKADEAAGDFDDLGYPIQKTAAPQGEADAPPAEGKQRATETPPKADDAAPTNSSGYGVDLPDAPPEPEVPPAPPVDLGYELDTKGLDKTEVDKLSHAFKEHGITKEAAQAMLDYRKSQIAESAKQVETARKAYEQEQKDLQARTRKQWQDQLKADPNFGGEKFGYNVAQAEKVWEMFPNSKKKLTDSGAMLPPYLMLDLAAIAPKLFGTGKMVAGNPTVPPSDDDSDDPLAFYK